MDIKCCSHHILSTVHTSALLVTIDVDLDHLEGRICQVSPLESYSFSPLSILQEEVPRHSPFL